MWKRFCFACCNPNSSIYVCTLGLIGFVQHKKFDLDGKIYANSCEFFMLN